MTFKRAIESGLVLGGLWAFVEVVLTYVTGFAPTGDVVEIALAPLAVLVLYQATVLAVAQVRPHRVFGLFAAAGALLPPVLFFWRGRGQRVPEHLVAGLLPIALCLLLVWRETRRPSDRAWLTPGRVVATLVLYFGAALAFALRADRVLAITSAQIATSVAWCAAVAVIGAIAVAATRRRPLAALSLVLVAASFAIAWQRGSGPPSYKEEAVRPPGSPSAKAGAPNVLLIVLDTVRADHLDLYGYSRPTFALTGKYLKDGLVFDRAASSGTFSLPSHASLFTGLLPSAHGARPLLGGDTAYGRLWPEVDTLASFLRGQGYRTAGVSANDIFLAEWTGLQKGFDTFSATAVRGVRFASLSTALRRAFGRITRSRRRLVPNNWTATQVTDAAIDIVSQKAEPFFLFLNYFDAHDPHAQIGSPPWFNPATAKPIDMYDTEIAYIDSEVARLLGTLRQRGRLNDTLVVVAADHGEYFGERKLRGHPAAVYEGSTHVPLALRLPGVVPQGRTGRRTGLHEVFRMVQDVLSRNSLDWLSAIDLNPRITTEAWARQDFDKAMPKDGRPSTTVVFAGNLKLIHRLSGNTELFDVEKDPGEAVNLIDSQDPAIVALKAKMLREVDLRAVRPPGPAQPLTEDAKERLRALGYLK
ncbi:MAG TPA: sulfatase [Vicinamibacteria bacterium]|nr:sulfatase [Vicinamibacteria bacterium]